MILRPLLDTAEDLEAVRLVAAAAFAAADAAEGEGDPPEPGPTPRQIAREDSLNRHFVLHDPDGCRLAVDEAGRVLGAAISSVREGTWGLSLLVVAPEAQGKGVGRALLRSALEYGAGCPRGIISGSRDPRAARAYWAAGFALYPALRFRGAVDPSGVPAPDGPVRAGGLRDRELLDAVDRRTRGGAHGPDHGELLRRGPLLVAEDGAEQGYCYAERDPEGVRIVALSGDSVPVCERLLSAVLREASAGELVRLGNVTGEQQWAVDLALRARLAPSHGGYVCLRGMGPVVGFVPSGQFL